MTAFTDEVRKTVSPHKFGGSRRAAAAYLISLDGMSDGESGEVEAPTGWFGIYGRTMLYEDSQGFVSVERFRTVDAAWEMFEALSREYDAWCEENPS